ncbi:MAG: hypothetical protein FWH38_10600, partial [Treponema sp.]|nr:hypothetical protein [Treponema sp.]
MFNVKWGVYSGGAAFILALLTSLLFGHAGFLIALLRALIFAVIFFGLGTGAWALINNHIPELLFTGAQNSAVTSIFSGDTPGARVNITLGDTSGVAIPEAGGASSAGDLGDIGDLISGKFDPAADAVKAKDIDQNPASGYNIPADLPPAQDAAAAKSGDGDFSMD